MQAAPTDGKRRAWTAALLLLAVAGAIAAGLLWLRPPVRADAEYLVFGSRARVDVLGATQEQADAALDAIGRQLAADHRQWHAWEPSPLTRLNDALAAGRSHRPPADIVEMIGHAKRGYRLSGGLFNPAAGRMIRAWGFHTSDYPVRSAAPADPQVDALVAEHPSMDDVTVDPDGSVRSRNPAVALDLNAMAEGFAAQQVRDLLAGHDIGNALVYIGGFVLAVGDDAGQPWQVGVRSSDGLLASLPLADGESLASSGDYERRRSGAGNPGHILDPRQGRPQRASAAASVLGRDPVLVDIAATALMVAGPEGAERLARGMGLGCVLLQAHDGTLHVSSALLPRLRFSDPDSLRIRTFPAATDRC